MSQPIEFNSSGCKATSHSNYEGMWRGLGIEVICICCCSKYSQNQPELTDDSSTTITLYSKYGPLQ